MTFSKKNPKGSYGYIKHSKKVWVIKTTIMYAVSLSLFIAGYIATKSKENMLTIVAVLGVLPATKSFVTTVLYVKAKGCSEKLHNKVKEYDQKQLIAYDLVFTAEDFTMEVPAIVVRDNAICGVTLDEKATDAKIKKVEEHLKTCLSKGGKQVTVKIFSKEDGFIGRLNQMDDLDDASLNQQEILQVLYEVSL